MNVREKGHRLERQVAAMLRDKGHEGALTTRANSKLLDACGVDIDGVPIFIQCKSGYKRGLNYTKIFEYMYSKLKSKFGKVTKPLVIIHKKDRKKYDNIVVIDDDDYYIVMAYEDFANQLTSSDDDIPRQPSIEPINAQAINDRPTKFFQRIKQSKGT